MRDRRERAERLTTGLLRPLALLWLAGVALRLTILALPPMLPAIGAELHLRGPDIGILTAIPSMLFALGAIPGAALIARVGAAPCLLLGLLINALGAAARGFAFDTTSLEIATACMCLGVAVMQPALPTLVRTWTPARTGLATAVYTCGLLCGEVLPVLITTGPDLPVIGGGWREVLFQWSIPVLAAAAIILVLRPRTRRRREIGSRRSWPNWRQASMWKVGLLLGAVNATYFSLNGFLPSWLSRGGGHSAVQPALLALNAAQIPASLLMMVIVERLAFRRAAYFVAGAAMLAGSLGLATAPAGLTIIFATLAGFALACLLTLALALPPLMVGAAELPSFSAGIFTIGYGIAVATAILIGMLENSGPNPLTSVLPIVAASLATIVIGATVGRLPIHTEGADPC